MFIKISFKRGDMILALEDYKIAAQLMPSKTDAMFEIGLFRFNNELVLSFTKFLWTVVSKVNLV